ncbi:MAG: ATP-binding protein [Halobacteriales archaeon]|nr:ATP-binding protein [Halobacteriales archaeon]
MSEEKSGPKMLRMVRYRGIKQDADRLRKPTEYDRHEALSLTIHMGDPRTAKRALFAWLREEMADCRRRHAKLDEWRNLRAQYYAMLGKINGRLTVMATELGYYSQNVAPDYGKVTYNYHDWAAPGFLSNLFGEGKEVVIQGHVGTGKTHLAVLLMDGALRLEEPRFTVITNVSGVEDTHKTFLGRIHHVSLLSEVLRIWADLPENARIVLVLDEPEATLQGGMSRQVLDYKVFRFMIRKLGIAKVEIWHNESDQYKGLREDKSEQVYRIHKDQKDAFTFARRFGDQLIKQRVENVPKDCGLTFATGGMATIDVDVNIAVLVRRIGKLWRPQDIKAEVRAALDDPHTYHAAFRSKEDDAKTEAVKRAQQDRRDAEVVAAILADPKAFLAKRGGSFDRNVVQRRFDLTVRDAEYLAMRAWQEKPKDKLESALAEILARPEDFMGVRQQSFDPEKIQAALGVTVKQSRKLALDAWKLREGS